MIRNSIRFIRSNSCPSITCNCNPEAKRRTIQICLLFQPPAPLLLCIYHLNLHPTPPIKNLRFWAIFVSPWPRLFPHLHPPHTPPPQPPPKKTTLHIIPGLLMGFAKANSLTSSQPPPRRTLCPTAPFFFFYPFGSVTQ